MENNTNDVYNTYNDSIAKTAKKQEYEKPHYNLQTVCHIKKEEDTDRSYLIDIRVFIPISENVTK